MQVAGQLCELGTSALFLAFLFVACDVAIVVIEIAAHLFVLRLDVLEVLLARIEVMLPSPRIVSAVAIYQKNASKVRDHHNILMGVNHQLS